MHTNKYTKQEEYSLHKNIYLRVTKIFLRFGGKSGVKIFSGNLKLNQYIEGHNEKADTTQSMQIKTRDAEETVGRTGVGKKTHRHIKRVSFSILFF